ncbi:GNAT family N-acetyltransferase [Actinocrispum sp. NPDC049592]|uniref:GNAT family N-acetyltransferase n=1 Tax=Actinocrispum sp. NPDC049592 TaxID=3154835 RepID=UPI003422C5D3
MDDRVAVTAELEVWDRTVSAMRPQDRDDLGMATARIGTGLALSVLRDPTGYWSKALGFTEPMTAGLVEEIIEFYRAAGSKRASLLLAPWVLPPDWADICAAYGLTPGGRATKLVAPVDAVHLTGHTDLPISKVEPGRLADWGRVALSGFDMPDMLAPIIDGLVNAKDFQHYAAWDGDRIAGGAVLAFVAGVGHLNTDATLPGYRNRGVQSALITTRIRDAAEAGCAWVVAETSDSGSSMENMLRAGLKPLYYSQNWVWQA